MAIVRFVNSLVDPLQTTYFARSIASLAQQIQLPLWFVELRHQATHEDLPSLGVLRDAARQALDWLYTHYWSPALSSSTSLSTSLPPLPLEPLRTLLLQTYKSLSKLTLRDASLVGRTRGEMRVCLGEVERWVVENSIGGRERAWEGVAEVVWSEGGLVPLAKKKRPTPRSPSLPTDLLALWTPLITHLDSLPSASAGSSFSDVLIKRGVDILCSSEAEGGEGKERDKSYLACVSAWVGEFMKDAPVSLETEEGEGEGGGEGGVSLKGVVKSCLIARTPAALSLIDSLLASRQQSPSSSSSDDPTLRDLIERTTPLLALARQVAQTSSSSFGPKIDSAEEATSLIDSLLARSAELSSHLTPAPPSPAPAVPSAGPSNTQVQGAQNEGWPRRVEGWKKRPIGFLPAGGFAGLDLPSLPAAQQVVVQ